MNNKGSKNLDLQYYNFIEQGLHNNSTKTSIADVFGMDKTIRKLHDNGMSTMKANLPP